MTRKQFVHISFSIAFGLSILCLSQAATAAETSASAKNSNIVTSIPDLRDEKDVKTKKRRFF